MRYRRFAAAAGGLGMALLEVACASRGPAPQDHFYPLVPTVQVTPMVGAPVAATLLVTRPEAHRLTIGREILFERDDRPGEVQRYNFHLWAEPPAVAIAESLRSALREARLFAFVVAPGERAQADYLLTGELDRLEHLPSAIPPAVVAELRLTLVNDHDGRVLWGHLYRGREPTANPDDPAAAPAAFDRLLGRLLGEAVRDLQALRPRLRAADSRAP
jgi:cholesterol transport system auxiliary component